MAITRVGGSWIHKYVSLVADDVTHTYTRAAKPELNLPNGSRCFEMDSDIEYIYDVENDAWEVYVPSSGEGSGGTTDYTQLTNKPSINNVQLSGNKTLAALGINAGTIGFDETETYTDGSVGKELSELKVLNNLVTPQMFGAVGDGITDDTEAIQDALDSEYNVYFPSGTYLTSGVSITSVKQLYFEDVTLKAKTEYQDYVISTTKRISCKGYLTIDGDNKALNGIKLLTAHRSLVEYIVVTKCLVWGINFESSGGSIFGYVYTSYCGTGIELNVSKGESRDVNVDSGLTEHKLALLTSEYAKNMFGYDISNFDTGNIWKMARFLAEYDAESTKFTTQPLAGNNFPSNYTERDFCVCLGGGILIGRHCSTQITIQTYNTITNAIGIQFTATYGHYITNYYSQGDRLPICVPGYSQGNYIGSLTVEGERSGYVSASYSYDYGAIGIISTGGTSTEPTSKFLAFAGDPTVYTVPFTMTAARRCVPYMYNPYDTRAGLTLYELSPDVVCFDRGGTFKIDLSDTYQGVGAYSYWGVKTIYFLPVTAQNANIKITILSNAVNAGYSLEGAVNNVLEIARPSPTAHFKLLITLINKTFSVYMEEMTKITPVT